MTLEYVIVQICQREYSPGLFYTGCSRVKDMEKLAIVGYSERTLNNGETTWFPPIQRSVEDFCLFCFLCSSYKKSLKQVVRYTSSQAAATAMVIEAKPSCVSL